MSLYWICRHNHNLSTHTFCGLIMSTVTKKKEKPEHTIEHIPPSLHVSIVSLISCTQTSRGEKRQIWDRTTALALCLYLIIILSRAGYMKTIFSLYYLMLFVWTQSIKAVFMIFPWQALRTRGDLQRILDECLSIGLGLLIDNLTPHKD